MARNTSWNVEIDVDGNIIHPVTLGEFSEGEEGRIEVADGGRKYKIRDQIFNVDEVPLQINMKAKDARFEYETMQAFVQSGLPRDVFVVFRDGAGVAQLTYLFQNCDCAYGKKNAFDRKSKSEDMKGYILLPDDIVEVE
jgi:hypothetical protein